jgi:hypothetical protein
MTRPSSRTSHLGDRRLAATAAEPRRSAAIERLESVLYARETVYASTS